MKIIKQLFASFVGKDKKSHFKEQQEKMRAHSQSDGRMQSCEAELAATTAMKEGSIIQQLQHVGEQEKLKNRIAIYQGTPSLYPLPCT